MIADEAGASRVLSSETRAVHEVSGSLSGDALYGHHNIVIFKNNLFIKLIIKLIKILKGKLILRGLGVLRWIQKLTILMTMIL